MEVIVKAFVHKENGTRLVTEYPELAGIIFQSSKEKERFSRNKLKEMFGDKFEDIPENTRMSLLLVTVIPPQGVTELAKDWQPDPIKPVKPPVYTPREHPTFQFRKPKMI